MCCSARFWSITAVLFSVLAASLPTMMSSLLRHMFTAPDQKPWPHGSLRLIDCNGIPAQPLNSAQRIEELTSHPTFHRDGDVWVVSYVKSGTTWTIGLLAALTDHPAARYCGNLQKMTRTFCPQPELPDLGWGDDGFGHSMEELDARPSPRYFKSHWPSRDFLSPNGKSKFIYVMRKAQDQMISHWNQVWGMGFHYGTTDRTFEGGWNGFVQDWLAGNVENGSWFDHVAGWYRRSKDDPNSVLLIRYEQLKTDTESVIRQIADFIGLEQPGDRKMAKVLDLTSFERMKASDDSDAGLQFMRCLGVLRKRHIRQGEIESGELPLTQKQREALEHGYKVKLKPLGVPRDWVLHG